MKGLLIAITLFAVIFVVAALIETYSNDQTIADTAETIKDGVGILDCMLIFWFFCCVIC